ncbi:MAG: DUF1015 domain-containing protein [Treponema sp.]|nr:DUF1015 domain-containing protein [Treponema sp.]
MDNINARLLALGLKVPQILLPRRSIDLSAWAVIACDQFTQDRPYWERVRQMVGDKPSTLNLIYPEVYLEAGGEAAAANPAADDREGRIAAIHRAMDSYLGGDVFAPPFTGCMYVERDSPYHRRRRGLVIAVDLDRYDWGLRARTPIRATEGTVPERLPPRMDIRRDAPLESPHVLLLIDDKQDLLLPGLAGLLGSAEPAYRGNLMLNSGSVSGWPLDREEQWAFIAGCLEAASGPFLYAVGDGNHSLAAAKGIWEEYKAAHPGEPGLAGNPRRFALVEIENLYDPAISFEPIHRIVFNTDVDALLKALAPLPGLALSPLEETPVEGTPPKGRPPEKDLERLRRLVGDREAPGTRLGLISGSRLFLLETSAPGLATAALQPLLDRFTGAAASPDSQTGRNTAGRRPSLDYIHGGDELIRLAHDSMAQTVDGTPAVGILLPPIRKEGLFETVARSGPLPRKSFSLGESVEKRFYLECRRLR